VDINLEFINKIVVREIKDAMDFKIKRKKISGSNIQQNVGALGKLKLVNISILSIA